MSNSTNSELSTTIANMIETLTAPRRKSELRPSLGFLSPLKRRLSSDSFDTPDKDKRLKTENSLDVSWISSPRESRRMRAELVETRSIIAGLENRILHMHGVRKELQVMLDNEIKSYILQHERDRKSIDELETQMQVIRKREKEIKDELDKIKSTVGTDKVDYESKIESLEISISRLESQLKVNKSDEDNEITSLNNRIEELEMLLEGEKQDVEIQQERTEELEAKASKLTSIERELEMKDQIILKNQLKIKELEYTLQGYGEWQAQAKIQQQKMSKYPDLEKEVVKLREETKHLRDEVQNKLILEEQVHDLQTRMETFRNQEKKMASLQASHNHLENMVEEWRLLVRGMCDVNVSDAMLPKQIRQCIEKLQHQELTLTSEKVQLESQLKQSQHESKLAKLELERSTKQLSNVQSMQQQQQALLHRLQKKLLLVSRERDSYRQQLDTYEKDLTMSIPPGGLAQHQTNVQRERIESLEKMVEGYREMVANLENEIRKNQPQLNNDTVVPIRSEQMSRMQEKIDRLLSENTRLTERCDELEIRLEQEMIGKDNVKGQVFHFKINPLGECISEKEKNVEKLQEEISRLKRKIRDLEDGLECSKLSETASTSQEVQALREQLESSKVKMMKMKECFKSSAREFRNACYMLFGYKIDRESNSQYYTLTSMYSESQDDNLQFQLNVDGNLHLLETPFSSTLEEMVDLHLRHQSSIPVFLSAITMDLFNRTTMTQ